MNRLCAPSSGRVFVDGADVERAEPTALRRRIGYVIQQVGLFPHMTVAQNVAIVPSLLGWSKAHSAGRVDELLELVHLDAGSYRARFPRELSGGQQQRVGLARALAADPPILLMDEPFGSVDAIEREHLQKEMVSLQGRLHKTILFVTHDVDEALRLADSIIVMRDGRIEQHAAPGALLQTPANDFVARLVDAHNILRRLSVIKAWSAVEAAGDDGLAPPAAQISGDASLQEALAVMLSESVDYLRVVGSDGKNIGRLSLGGVRSAASAAAANR